MFKLIAEPGTGKTKKLIEHVAEHGGIILCKNPTRMIEKARAYGYPEVRFTSFAEFFNEGRENENYYIDDLDDFLDYISPQIKGFVCTK